jgi:hypothetical protein
MITTFMVLRHKEGIQMTAVLESIANVFGAIATAIWKKNNEK